MSDREFKASLFSSSLALAREFTSSVATDDCVSKFLNKLEQVDDMCAHSVCEALYRSWCALRHSVNTFPSDSQRTVNPLGEGTSVTTSHTNLLWAQIALDFTWSKLNSGHWKDVPLIWREAYATSALFIALGLLNVGRLQEALGEIDRGILLGVPVFTDAIKCLTVTLTHEIQEIERNSWYGDNTDVSVSQQGVVEGHRDVEQMDNSGIGKVVFRNYSSYHNLSTHSTVRTCQSCGDTGTLCSDLSITPVIDMTRRITVVNCPSLEEFYHRYMMSSTSVVISGVMDHWPAYATNKWR